MGPPCLAQRETPNIFPGKKKGGAKPPNPWGHPNFPAPFLAGGPGNRGSKRPNGPLGPKEKGFRGAPPGPKFPWGPPVPWGPGGWEIRRLKGYFFSTRLPLCWGPFGGPLFPAKPHPGVLLQIGKEIPGIFWPGEPGKPLPFSQPWNKEGSRPTGNSSGEECPAPGFNPRNSLGNRKPAKPLLELPVFVGPKGKPWKPGTLSLPAGKSLDKLFQAEDTGTCLTRSTSGFTAGPTRKRQWSLSRSRSGPACPSGPLPFPNLTPKPQISASASKAQGLPFPS